MDLDEKKKFIINFTYLSVCFLIIYFVFKIVTIYLFPFLIGIIIAYAVQKPAAFLSKKTKFNKQNCAAVLSVVVFVSLIAIVTLLAWLFYTQFSSLISYLSNHTGGIKNYIGNAYEYFENFFKNIGGNFHNAFKKFTNNAASNIINKISTLLSNSATNLIKKLPTIMISCAVTVVATCYISKDYKKLLKFIKGFLSDNFYQRFIEIKNIFSECFFKFAVGYFWLFIITFFELSFGFLILKIEHFIALAFLVAMLDLLPVFGTGTVLLPWGFLMFFQGEFHLGFGLVLLYLVITVIRNFTEPKIIGRQIGVNPLFTLLFIFLGFRLGGIVGMLILPMTLTILFTYCRRRLYDSD